MSSPVSLATHKRIRQQMEKKRKAAMPEEYEADNTDQETNSSDEIKTPNLNLNGMGISELRELARINDIDLTGLNRKQDIVNYITKSLPPATDDDLEREVEKDNPSTADDNGNEVTVTADDTNTGTT